MDRRARTGGPPRGFTLIEALLASAILAMAIVAVTLPFSAGAQIARSDGRLSMAAALAQEMMDEILSKPYEDPQGGGPSPGPEPGETGRDQFDNMDDYDGYAEAAGNVRNVPGEVCTDGLAAGLSRSVRAQYVRAAEQGADEAPALVQVTVTVLYRGQTVLALSRLAYGMP